MNLMDKFRKKKPLVETASVKALPEGPPSKAKPGEKAKGSRYHYEQSENVKADAQARVNAANAARAELERKLQDETNSRKFYEDQVNARNPEPQGRELKTKVKEWKTTFRKSHPNASEEEQVNYLTRKRQEDMNSRWQTYGPSRGKSAEGHFTESESDYAERVGMPRQEKETFESYEARTKKSYGDYAGSKVDPSDPNDPRFAGYSKSDKKKYSRFAREAEQVKAKAEFEAASQGTATGQTKFEKVWQNKWFFDTTTGKAVTEKYAKEHPDTTDMHPGQWTFKELTQEYTPAQKINAAREQEAITQDWNDYQRQRKWKPVTKAAGALGGAAQGIGQAMAVGVAGMGSALMPSQKGGPGSGVPKGSLVPNVPMELYAPRRESISQAPMQQAVRLGGNPNTGGLNHLRVATMPGMNIPAQSKPMPIAGQPYNPQPQRIPLTSSNSLRQLGMPKIRTQVPNMDKLRNTVRRNSGI